jgi:hypothetical protein
MCRKKQFVLIAIGAVCLVGILLGLLALLIPDNSYWEAVTAFWAAIAAIATGAAVFVAWFQLGALRDQQQEIKRQQKEIKDQQRGWETLRVCNQYDLDPVLATVVGKLRALEVSKSKVVDYSSVRMELRSLLNYFDSIAIGIKQNFYMENIVEAHLGGIISDYRNSCFSDDEAQKLGFGDLRERYSCFIELADRWEAEYSTNKSC